MKVIEELYALPDKGEYILYAPLKHTILRVNRDVIALILKIKNGEELPAHEQTIRVVDGLRRLKIIDSEASAPFDSDSNEYKPTSVTFLPTSDCNLKCIYCYADSGMLSKYLPLHVARAAIDFVFDNARHKNVPEVQIGFLGGGEPFLAWQFVKEIFEYGQRKSDEFQIPTYFTGVTNGMLSTKQTLWISKHFQYLNVSVDGTQAIHDEHRPTKSNKGSFETVLRTLQTLNEQGFRYGVRSTISSLSVDSMTSIVKFFTELGISKIHFEPLFACGRCRTNNELAPAPKLFIDNFVRCLSIVQSTNTDLLCSAIRMDTLSTTFCGALNNNFYITPEGYVTSCTEVSLADEPLSSTFFIGKYDQAHKGFVFWDKRRELLTSRTVLNMPKCGKCIAKWHCAGACPVKAAYEGDLFDATGLANCQIARELTEYHVRRLANEESNYLSNVHPQAIFPMRETSGTGGVSHGSCE
jgi:uncharacterized protein